MKKYYYLIHFQYLGFRFHGWAKQPAVKTVHKMIDKTVAFVLNHKNFKTLGSSRTDAMVSANHNTFELFLTEELPSNFIVDLNYNLPNDIRVLKIEQVDQKFNIIQSPKIKEYVYLFSFGEKVHPFSAAILSSFPWGLDIELMKKGAKLFEGTHNFIKYCTKPKENTQFVREILMSRIEENKLYTANFFPKSTFLYKVKAKGFMRNQVRLIMGQLILLGKGEISPADIDNSLSNPDEKTLDYIAPASGLILNKQKIQL